MNSLVFLGLLATTSLVPSRTITEQDQKPFEKSCFLGTNDNDAVDNLVKNKKVVTIATNKCDMAMRITGTITGPDSKFFNPTTVCLVGIPTDPKTSQTQVYVYTEPTPGLRTCSDDESSKAVYLPEVENHNTYMIIDADKEHWLFTDVLTGCEMFVATHRSQPKKLLVMHANHDKYDKDHKKNFEKKGEIADAIMQTQAVAQDYELRFRLHPQRDTTPELTQYWNTYKQTHQNVQVLSYNNYAGNVGQGLYFFGQYHVKRRKQGWKFSVKGKIDGVTTEVINLTRVPLEKLNIFHSM